LEEKYSPFSRQDTGAEGSKILIYVLWNSRMGGVYKIKAEEEGGVGRKKEEPKEQRRGGRRGYL
jgi:hypothetical protein